MNRSLGLEAATPEEARGRAQEAREHIERASYILHEMQSALTDQAARLDELLRESEEKKRLADEYGLMAATAESQLEPFRRELVKSVRSELEAQGQKGRFARISLRILGWLITLGMGAWLGAYFSAHYGEISSIAQGIVEKSP